MMSAQDLLLEIGTEELPASFLDKALAAMPGLFEGLMKGARVAHGAVRPLGTPRRLALLVEGVAERQEDLSMEVVGPPKRVAMDDEGKLTKAGQGFAKKQGVSPDDLRVVTTDKGEYVAYTKAETGRPAVEVLPELLEELCRKIPFQKSMRWGAGDVAFGRPIHWVVCLHGGEVVPMTFASVDAGKGTRGHRFLSPEALEVESAGAYVDALREVHVYVDPTERRERMEKGLAAAAEELGGTLVEDAFLVGECAGMVEEPFVVPGSFDASFLDLPRSVIVSVMRDHQRYFAVEANDAEADGGARLLPRYLNVVNTANAPDVIAKGNDRVLRARLADARFFVDEDRKVSLDARVPRLDDVVFQKKLGSVGDKVRRVSGLAAHLGDLGDAGHGEAAGRAARLAKVDLVTLIVGEFPELQGEMGEFYAREQGIDDDVAAAIREHYLPRGAGDSLPTSPVSAAVAIADRADTLAGCFGIGLVPTGSADPFALRRAALGIIRIALDGPTDVLLGALLRAAVDAYPAEVLGATEEVVGALTAFFRARLKAYYSGLYPTDLVEACLGAWDGESLRDLSARVGAVARFREMPEYESLAVAFKRAIHIAKDAPAGQPDPALVEDGAEKALADAFAAL
ncbi:MAG: glycine--tRNA ligase subunit beta, partial [Deltaproteobacteria bacterium]|nr:glycine--tRNA ligase subunit beta [Deltaproteobacteria bacterium]